MIKPTIAVTLYRRPDYAAQLFAALKKCYGIQDIPIAISCDYNEEHDLPCELVYGMALEFAGDMSPGQVRVYQNRPRLGIDLNKLFVIPKAFERGDFVIFIEDDTVPSVDSLRYFQNMAERYESDERVWSVCGYNNISARELSIAHVAPYAVGLARGFNPWLWGAWRNRWDELFGDNGEVYQSDTKEQANGLFDHWLSKKDRLFVAPVIPRTKLIGEFNAEHTTPEDWERERNEWGAWNLDLPDLLEWPVDNRYTEFLHVGTAAIENENLH